MAAEMSDRWTEEQRRHYGKLYRFISTNFQQFVHPSTPALTAEQQDTIAHNAAFLAAEMLEPGDIDFMDLDSGEIVASTKSAGPH